MTCSGRKSSVEEQGVVLFGWFDGGFGWLVSLFCFVLVPPHVLLSYLLSMGGKWKEYFFKNSAIVLCIKVFLMLLN